VGKRRFKGKKVVVVVKEAPVESRDVVVVKPAVVVTKHAVELLYPPRKQVDPKPAAPGL